MYTCLEPSYTFTSIAIETLQGFGPLTLQFLRTLAIGSDRLPVMKNSMYLHYPETVCVNAERKYSINAGNHWILTLFYRLLLTYFI